MNQWLQAQAAGLGIGLSADALLQLQRYQQLLQEWNQQINLTSITAADAVNELHFLDSLSVQLAVDLRQSQSLVDVGTGAGFPGLVLAVAFPHLQVTLVESIEKKAGFLRAVSQELQLASQVTVSCLRAEEAGWAKPLRDRFDVAVARGVARLNVLAEYCLPLVRAGGCFVAMKGPSAEPEVAEALRAVRVLGGGAPEQVKWGLPSGAGRTLVRIPKLGATPTGYPRRVGLPAKKPLL